MFKKTYPSHKLNKKKALLSFPCKNEKRNRGKRRRRNFSTGNDYILSVPPFYKSSFPPIPPSSHLIVNCVCISVPWRVLFLPQFLFSSAFSSSDENYSLPLPSSSLVNLPLTSPLFHPGKNYPLPVS